MTKGKQIGIIVGIIVAIIVIASAAYLITRPSTSSQASKSSAPPSSLSVTIRVGGATAPMYQINYWIKVTEQKYPNITIVYDAVGSGKGIAGFLEGIYDIALHDPPMPTRQWEQAYKEYGPLLECPDVGGAVVIIYNIPHFHGIINLTGPLIADIFMGKITSWCDREILKYNPGLAKICEKYGTDIPIRPIVRREASGTTFIFVTYLTLVSSEFRTIMEKQYNEKGPFAFFLPDWQSIWVRYTHNPAYGLSAKGNYGIASTVKTTPGAIGYVEWSYAIFNNLTTARIMNKAGRFVAPTYGNIEAAFENAAKILEQAHFNPLTDLWKEKTYEKILNPPGINSYPIIFFSHLTIKLHYKDLAKAIGIYRFLSIVWSLHNHYVKGYIPVPVSIREICLNAMRSHMTVNGVPITRYVGGG
ncbi:MAG: phosphate ABC transporter substrate-binding protein PstS [Crenarchaeota archaeon]|nr:phosphate ABC transporter substrate-binding protein PstS [Thermoproteota archaeon]